MRGPLQLCGVDGIADGTAGAEVVLYDFGRQGEYVLPLVVADEGQLLQDDDDVICAHARGVADLFDRHRLVHALEVPAQDVTKRQRGKDVTHVRITRVQYEWYDTRPRSLSGRSGVPTLPSFLDSSYEKDMRNLP